MTRRVLIVVSAYAPAMAADMHRARHLAWELPSLGWDVEILCPHPSLQVPMHLDKDSDEFFEKSARIYYGNERIGAIMRRCGLRSAASRSLLGMAIEGRRLLKSRHYDLVYISTASFILFILGFLWWKGYGSPFILDIHDPIYNPSFAKPRSPSLGIKQRFAQTCMRHIESYCVYRAATIVAVSPAYLEQLHRRYGAARPGWMRRGCATVIPFSVLPRDFEMISLRCVKSNARSSKARIVYVGAGGPIMRRSFSLLCDALADLQRQHPSLADAVQIELYGTDLGWREGDPHYLADIAQEKGLRELVSEAPGHVSYRRSLELLLDGDGALILGVDDAGYMPSKLYPYAYSGKPLLGVVRREGPAFAAFQTVPNLGHSLWFDDSGPMPLAEAVAVLQIFLEEVVSGQRCDRSNVLQPFIASSMASRHARLFERILALQGMPLVQPVAEPSRAVGK